MKEARKVKGLKSQLKIMEGDLEALKIEVSNKQLECNAKSNSIKKLKIEIEKYEKNNNIKVSEHAIIRYLERVKGLDISQIENEILSPDVLRLVDTLGGTGKYPNNDFKVVLSEYTVTTILK